MSELSAETLEVIKNFNEKGKPTPQLDRMLRFHLVNGGVDFATRAKHIRAFQRHPENKIKVIVVTDMIGPQGPVGYEVEEPFDYCIEMYTAALEGRPISILLDPQTRFSSGKILER